MGFFVDMTHHFSRRGRVARFALPGVFLLIILLTDALQAQEGPLATPLNNKEPIKITSDTLEADNRNQTFLFKGNVKVIQGSTEITSERLKVWYKNDGGGQGASPDGASRIRDIEAGGNVVILFDGRTARSERALYSADKGTLTLLGENATIIDGKNTIRGSKITLYRTQDRITVEGDRPGRVEVDIFPGNNDTSK
jgi:lipopolysaccharide export system protein LptA